MSSDEDFSLVQEPSKDALDEVLASIANYKKKYQQLLQEQSDLRARRDDSQKLTQDFKRRTEKVTRILEDDERDYMEELGRKEAKLKELMLEEPELVKSIDEAKKALKEEKARNNQLRQQTDVFAAVPQRTVVFKGSTGEAGNTPVFDMEPQIVYPMDGGTALITFEEEVVARKILQMGEHQVDLSGEVYINVEAKPVHLMMPRVLEIASEVCPRRVLISNLPKMDIETLMNKLEIHFSKTKNGGGEVEDCEMMSDSWNVVVTFVENHIARGLTDTEYHDVKLKQTKHRVRVTPFINGNITNLETGMSVCPRTVLLTGIPDIMERDNLQDLLEIHFQKSTNGGGEIEAILYNPLGQNFSALFTGISQEEEEE